MQIRGIALTALFLTLILGAQPLLAQSPVDLTSYPDFNPNFILSDDDIFDATSLTFDQMASFLRSKGRLTNYRLKDTDGVEKTAAEIIWRVAQSYKINPKYLLALLQKEQSLVEDPNPSPAQFDWATGYGICDSCSKDSPSVQEFKGFASQIEWAAKQHREKYLFQLLINGWTLSGMGKNKTSQIDGMSVTPANHATAMLFTYTPHIRGNLSLWKIWQRWFKTIYPDGTVVRAASSGKTYLIRFGEKRAFASPAVFSALTLDPNKVVTAPDVELEKYPDGKAIKFAKYSLLSDPDDKIFLLTETGKRRIVDMATFKKFGFNLDEVQTVTAEDLAEYATESDINATTTFPQGALVKVAGSPGVWYVENGRRQPLISPVFLTLYFPHWRIREVSAAQLETFPIDPPYHLHDGELVKSNVASSVYVMENGLRRPIPSATIFEQVGWQWKNIVEVSDGVLNIHALGLPFTPI
jgi:hypothetical protein